MNAANRLIDWSEHDLGRGWRWQRLRWTWTKTVMAVGEQKRCCLSGLRLNLPPPPPPSNTPPKKHNHSKHHLSRLSKIFNNVPLIFLFLDITRDETTGLVMPPFRHAALRTWSCIILLCTSLILVVYFQTRAFDEEHEISTPSHPWVFEHKLSI